MNPGIYLHMRFHRWHVYVRLSMEHIKNYVRDRNCSEEKEQQTKMSGGGSGRSSFCVSESLCTTRKNRGTDHSSSSSLCCVHDMDRI